MSEQSITPGNAPVRDRRPVPLGVLPRHFQTWLMALLALGIVAIIFIAGDPEPSRGPAPATTAPPAPNPDRLREYQERLRAMEARAIQDSQPAMPAPVVEPPSPEPQARTAQDPIVAERRRREYESLFASNVVLSRRPDSERPDAGRANRNAVGAGAAMPANVDDPSLDDIADAVVRATSRVAGSATPSVSSTGLSAGNGAAVTTRSERERTPDRRPRIDGSSRFPLLVAERAGRVIGWAGLSSYRPRACYAGIAEFSIYLDRGARGHGVGRELLNALIDAARERGYWKIVERLIPENLVSAAADAPTGASHTSEE